MAGSLAWQAQRSVHLKHDQTPASFARLIT